MKEIKLFEIPIYSMKEEEYKKRCFDYIDKNAKCTSKENYDDFHEYLKRIYYIDRQWKYNQIVGYITISYSNESVWFEKYATFDKKIHAISNKKHYIHNYRLSGFHFYIYSSMSNDEIKKEICKWLKSIEDELIPKPLFLDKELFELQIKNLNIKNMIS